MKFTRKDFNWDGMYLTYGTDRRFVARFKRQKKDRAGFTSFLIKNFTVEEYFAAYDAGKSPVDILESKGYVTLTVRQIITRAGYPGTLEGRDAYIKAQVAARRAA